MVKAPERVVLLTPKFELGRERGCRDFGRDDEVPRQRDLDGASDNVDE
jgi:hypothetical protein